MMFPTANSSIFYNGDGEVIGWESHDYDPEPEGYDPGDRYYDNEPEPADEDECRLWRMHGRDGDGVAVDQDGQDIFECAYCQGRYTINEAGDSMGPDAKGRFTVKIDNN